MLVRVCDAPGNFHPQEPYFSDVGVNQLLEQRRQAGVTVRLGRTFDSNQNFIVAIRVRKKARAADFIVLGRCRKDNEHENQNASMNPLHETPSWTRCIGCSKPSIIIRLLFLSQLDRCSKLLGSLTFDKSNALVDGLKFKHHPGRGQDREHTIKIGITTASATVVRAR